MSYMASVGVIGLCPQLLPSSGELVVMVVVST